MKTRPAATTAPSTVMMVKTCSTFKTSSSQTDKATKTAWKDLAKTQDYCSVIVAFS